jgi:hypothetical protein
MPASVCLRVVRGQRKLAHGLCLTPSSKPQMPCPAGRKAEDGPIDPRYNLRAGGLLVAYSSWFRYALPHEQHA